MLENVQSILLGSKSPSVFVIKITPQFLKINGDWPQSVGTLSRILTVGGLFAGGGYGSAGKSLVGQSFGKLGTVIENSAGEINSFYRSYAKNPYHGLDQIISRGVSPELLLNTIKNPLVTLEQTSGNILRLTNEAGVVLDKAGNIVTSYTKDQFLPHIKQILEKVNNK